MLVGKTEQKSLRLKRKCRSSRRAFFIFLSRAVSRAAPQQTERREEAILNCAWLASIEKRWSLSCGKPVFHNHNTVLLKFTLLVFHS